MNKKTAEQIHKILNHSHSRVLMSALILISLFPFPVIQEIWFIFFVVFGIEFAARVSILPHLGREDMSKREKVTESIILTLDLLALISFLPIHHIIHGGRYLRLFRFVRLIILFGYWGQLFRNLYVLTTKQERAKQLYFLLATVLGISMVAAAFLYEIDREAVQQKMGIEHQPHFWEMFWWSFRQVQDPGNLSAQMDASGIWLISLFLTIAGLFIFSFLVGIGTSVVGELLEQSRQQPLGLRDHSVILNAGTHTYFFLNQIVDYYRKQFRNPRWMVLSHKDIDFSENNKYKKIYYRHGNPYHPDDLAKVDAAKAKRIVLLADPQSPNPDAETISAVLSTRRLNPNAHIYAEIYDEKNASATIAAGGDRTAIVATEHMLALVLANVLANPGSYEIIQGILSPQGNEVYTYIYLDADRKPMCREGFKNHEAFRAFARYAYDAFDTILIGLVVSSEKGSINTEKGLSYLLDPGPGSAMRTPFPDGQPISGLIGLAPNFETMSNMAQKKKTLADDFSPSLPDLTDYPNIPLSYKGIGAESKILICGFHERTTLLIENLIQFAPGITVYIMIQKGDLARVRELILNSGVSINQFSDTSLYNAGPRGEFMALDENHFTYSHPNKQKMDGNVQLLTGTWSSRESLLKEQHGYRLKDISQILIQMHSHEPGDPDAMGVLTLLKLENLHQSEEYRRYLHEDLHIVVEIADVMKAELMRQRYKDKQNSYKVTIVPTEKIRNLILFHATVVPGFGPIFKQLFSREGPIFQELHPGAIDTGNHQDLPLGELAWLLNKRHDLILLGLKIKTDDGFSFISPFQNPDEPRIILDKIIAIYAIGDKIK